MDDPLQARQTEIALVAHNLLEPVRAIHCYVELLAEEPGQSELCIRRIREGAARLETLIRGVFECLQMPESFQAKPVTMKLVFLSAVSRLPEADRAGITSADLPGVMGDFEILTDVLSRLIDNAIKFRGERPAKLHISASLDPSGAWIFALRDHGVGVAEADWERCFGIFQRLHSGGVPGEGIGLAYCRRAIELHGGRIWMDSQLGSGTTIFFTLPAP
ncbi:MAG: hypothetical protein K2X03_07620 [Bryobacteraceae bacterium]|nr:hypothetical protein [Bryobacteraceae bacterium]